MDNKLQISIDYLRDLTSLNFYRSITDYNYLVINIDLDDSIYVFRLLKNKSIPHTNRPFTSLIGIYVKIEDVYNTYLSELRDEKINNILKWWL